MKCLCCILMCMLLSVTGIAEWSISPEELEHASLRELIEAREQIERRIAELQTDNVFYNSGVYIVGEDMPEGVYVILENEDAILANIVAHYGEDSANNVYDLVLNQIVTRLSDGAYVTLSNVTAWKLEDAPIHMLSDGETLSDGGYLVGAHLTAGEYTIRPIPKAPLSCYGIYSDVLGTDAETLKFERITEAVTVELRDGQYITLSGVTLQAKE